MGTKIKEKGKVPYGFMIVNVKKTLEYYKSLNDDWNCIS